MVRTGTSTRTTSVTTTNSAGITRDEVARFNCGAYDRNWRNWLEDAVRGGGVTLYPYLEGVFYSLFPVDRPLADGGHTPTVTIEAACRDRLADRRLDYRAFYLAGLAEGLLKCNLTLDAAPAQPAGQFALDAQEDLVVRLTRALILTFWPEVSRESDLRDLRRRLAQAHIDQSAYEAELLVIEQRYR